MAGIGFELRKLLRQDTFWGTICAYAYAGLISSGPWIVSILSMFLLYFLNMSLSLSQSVSGEFMVSVTWLICWSLVLSGGWQLLFTRFMADRLEEKRHDAAVPNFLGMILVLCLTLGIPVSAYLLHCCPSHKTAYALLMGAGFTLLCISWISSIVLSGMKEYGKIALAYCAGYGLTVVLGVFLRGLGTEGLLLAFVLGQAVLCFSLAGVLIAAYPSGRLMAFEFLDLKKVYPSLFLCGLLYNFGIWADKVVFWLSPSVSFAVVGPLRASIIYDTPLFIAYFAVIPGLAVYLLHVETAFADVYKRYFDAISTGVSLDKLEELKGQLIFQAREGLIRLFKTQLMAFLLAFLAAPSLFSFFGMSSVHMPLFMTDVLSVSLLIVFMAVINYLFYLDRRRETLKLAALFAVLNTVLSIASVALGPDYYGYGFAGALLACNIVGLRMLSEKLENLEYYVFMAREN